MYIKRLLSKEKYHGNRSEPEIINDNSSLMELHTHAHTGVDTA